MSLHAVFLVLLGLSPTAELLQVDAKAKLQGTWLARSADRNGKPAPDIKGHELTFRGERYSITLKGKVLYQGTYKVDATRKPWTIDFQHEQDPMKGKTWHGILSLEGNVLRICDNGADPTKGRPRTFMTTPDSGHVLVVFKRADAQP